MTRDELALRGFAEDDGLGVQVQVVGGTHTNPTDFLPNDVEKGDVVGRDGSGCDELVYGDDLSGNTALGVDGATAKDGGVLAMGCILVREERGNLAGD